MEHRSVIHQRDDEVARLRNELRRLISDCGVTQRSIEQKNGFTQGYLSQVLKGHIALGARHIYGILCALGVSPQEFFAGIYGRQLKPVAEDPLGEIRERLARFEGIAEQLERQGLITALGPQPRDPAS